VELFDAPHPTMGKTLFWEQLVTWECLRGEFFVMPLDDADQPVDLATRKPRVKKMLTLNPDMFWHMVIGHTLEGWRYTGSPLVSPIPSEMLLPTEVVQGRMVNPYLYWRGMSPLLVALLPASADYAAEMFMKGLLMNNADTGVIATTDQSLTREQREQFMAALRERKRKAGTPDRPLFLSSGVKIEKPTISNVDMQFLETRKLLRQEIGAIFKVPESIMGFSEAKSSSLSGGGNALSEEKLTFLEQTVSPKCHRYETAMDPIVKTFGDDLIGWFDISGMPIMQAARRSRVDSAVKVFGLGVPFNEINEVYDLGFSDLPWGDKGYLPFSLQPADAVEEPMPAEGDLPGPGNKPEADDGTPDQNANLFSRASRLLGETQKGSNQKLWEHHMRQRRETVRMFSSKVKRVLNEFRGKVLDKLNAHGAPKSESLLTSSPTISVRSLVDLIFDVGHFARELLGAVTPVMEAALQSASDQLRTDELDLDDPWKFPPPKAVEFIKGRTQDIQGCGATVRSQLNTALKEGIENGESTEKLAARVKGVFNNLGRYESERVARTETAIAFNFARHESMAHAGVRYKSWLSSHGPNVRQAHADAEMEYRENPIPIDEAFEVGGEELMYPGDPDGSPENVINCQCVQLAAKPPKDDEE
jgi:HK97 family phage portal protein